MESCSGISWWLLASSSLSSWPSSIMAISTRHDYLNSFSVITLLVVLLKFYQNLFSLLFILHSLCKHHGPFFSNSFNHCLNILSMLFKYSWSIRWQDKERLGRLISPGVSATDGNESVAPSLLFSTTYLVLNQVCFANKPKWKGTHVSL